jgi:hypothetical protein
MKGGIAWAPLEDKEGPILLVECMANGGKRPAAEKIQENPAPGI